MYQNRGEPDLSFIQPDVNLKDVSRLETKKVIHLTNEFLIRIADISNSFMQKMETKIFELEKKIDALDTVLVMVETKLENVEVKNSAEILSPPSASNIEKAATRDQPSPSISVANAPLPAPTPALTTVEEPVIEIKQDIPPPVIAPQESKADEGNNKIKISEHPTFSKYFKMLRLGIPELGVKQKMASEGIDTNLLDTPNALIDPPSVKPEESEDDGSESDSSFSSSD
uniref:WASH complex subunit 3 n=1 Tax=Panagrolaimus sp. PS1159 TaxID=55785 RepID=A0AC35FVY4_9BILA